MRGQFLDALPEHRLELMTADALNAVEVIHGAGGKVDVGSDENFASGGAGQVAALIRQDVGGSISGFVGDDATSHFTLHCLGAVPRS